MNRYIWIGFLSALMLIGCGDSKEKEKERREREFWGDRYDSHVESLKGKKLFMECYEKNVQSLADLEKEAYRMAGTHDTQSKKLKDVYRRLSIERDKSLEECNKLREGS